MRSLLRSITKMILLVPALVALVGLRLIRPLVEVRIMVVAFHKYGHLALEPELALLEIESESARRGKKFPRIITWWSFGPEKLRANPYLVEKWKQVLSAKPSWWLDALIRAGRQLPFLSLPVPTLSIQKPMQQLSKTDPRLQFSSQERSAASRELAVLGINVSKPFVCLVVRDDGHYGDVVSSENPDCLSANFDVEQFVLASKELVAMGYQVIRMGAGKEKPMLSLSPGIFDYAKSAVRSPFLDVYLAANCAFAVSTQTGPDAVSLLFRRPVCFIDISVFSQFFFGTNLAFWNPCSLKKDDAMISLQEIVTSDKVWAKYAYVLRDQGIDGVRLTSEEIAETVKEFATLFSNDFSLPSQDADLCMKANEQIAAGMGQKGKEGFGEIQARISPSYLRRNAHWFLQ
jgi:putative glycosyltransferase (TIGR04372 family)